MSLVFTSYVSAVCAGRLRREEVVRDRRPSLGGLPGPASRSEYSRSYLPAGDNIKPTTRADAT